MSEDGETVLGKKKRLRARLFRLVTWAVTIGCFYLVYTRVQAAAGRDGLTVLSYLARFFREADWTLWLSLMVPYSILFFVVDSHATWRIIRWYNAPSIGYRNVLPIRASAYILSLVNEQVSKGAMSLYLLRRYEVPVWQAVSTMIMLGMIEIYQLLVFSAAGVVIYYDLVEAASTTLPLPKILIAVYAILFGYFPLHILYFNGTLLPKSALRDKPIFYAF
ncbi:MAG: hypothetical protein KDI19_09825, partial [Pseudomonadales bacterium]|nr:hypothetical protein [Pseudomonadales bacterium]